MQVRTMHFYNVFFLLNTWIHIPSEKVKVIGRLDPPSLNYERVSNLLLASLGFAWLVPQLNHLVPDPQLHLF